MTPNTDLLATLGRDTPRRHWSVRASGRLEFDSAVINSNGISGIVFAARLARDARFSGRVTVVSPPVEETRRLVNGVTLRARAIDFYAAALGVSRATILGEIFANAAEGAEAHDQRGALAWREANLGYKLGRTQTWMTNTNMPRGRREHKPLAYGVRNSRLVAALNAMAARLGVQMVGEKPGDLTSLTRHAMGKRPLIVNGGHAPILGAPFLAPPFLAKKIVLAAQLAFTDGERASRGVLTPHSAFVAPIKRDGACDLGVFYPFRDPLSPNATFYGIYYRVCESQSLDKASELEHLTEEVKGVGSALGLEPHDADATLATAAVPCTPWRGTQNRQTDVLDLSWLSGSGAPIITGDGMLRTGLGALTAAEAVLAGEDAATAVDKVLARYRFFNRVLHDAMTWASPAMVGLTALSPRLALWPFGYSRNLDMWADVS